MAETLPIDPGLFRPRAPVAGQPGQPVPSAGGGEYLPFSPELFRPPPPSGIAGPPPVEELGIEDVPGFRNKLLYQLGQVVSRDPEQLGGIIKNLVPEAQLKRLGSGVLAVEMPGGKRYYLNRPGMSRQDLIEVLSDLTAGIGTALGAGRLGRFFGLGRAGNVALQALGAGGQSVGLDVAASGLGSEEGISGQRALLAGGGAAAGELLAPLLPRMVAFLKSAPQARLIDEAGELTATGQALFRQVGLDVRAMSAEQLQAVAGALRQAGLKAGDDAALLARRATEAAAPGEFGIRQTLGQRTGDPSQLAIEDRLRGGGGGDTGRTMIREFDQAQRADVERAIGATTERLTGRPPMDETTIGQEVMAGGRAAYSSAREAEDAAWAAWRASNPRGFVIAPLAGDRLRQSAAAAVADYPMSDATPTANRLLREITQFGRDAEGNPVPLDLVDADRLRRMFSNANPTAPEDRRAIGLLRGAYDEWLETLADRGLAEGDPESVELLQKAVGLSRERAGLVRPRGASRPIQNRLQRLVDDDLSGQQVANWLYGEGQLSGAKESRQTIQAVQNLLGDNQPAREAIRQGALIRLFTGATEDAGGYLKIANRINEALVGNGREISGYLFSEAERDQLRRFGDSLRRLAEQRHPQNPSGSAWTILGALTGGGAGGASLLSYFGDTGLALGGALAAAVAGGRVLKPLAREMQGEAQARAATAGGDVGADVGRSFLADQPLARLLRRVGPAAGAAAGEQLEPEP